MPLVRLCALWFGQLVIGVFLSSPVLASSAAQISNICHQAAQVAATQRGVPKAVLQAITLTETGRRLEGSFRPWPWTVNMEGKGFWFDTRAEALAFVKDRYEKGARSFDVGCFQINYRWHGMHFNSIEQMFDPVDNAVYAGKFLRDLHAESGSWSASAGAYHSRTPKHALRYRGIFDRHLARLTNTDVPAAPEHQEVPMNIAEAQGQVMDDVPETPWIPPPPSEFGSIAAVEYQRRNTGPLLQNSQPLLRQAQPLLTQPRGGLF